MFLLNLFLIKNMNKIWNFLLIIGIVVSFISGSVDKVGEVLLNSTMEAFKVFLKLALLMIFWNGMFNIAIKSGLLNNLTKVFEKPLSKLFPELKDNFLNENNLKDNSNNSFNKEIKNYLCSNLVANFLGLGAPATLAGLKALELLQAHNPHPTYPTKTMVRLVILNICTLTIFPTTIISMRSLMGAKTNFSLTLLMIITSLASCSLALFLDFLINLFSKFKKK